MSKHILSGVLAVMLGLGGASVAVWADDDKGEQRAHGGGYSKGKGYGHGSYGHGLRGHHGTAGHLIRGLLSGAEEMGLTADQVKRLKDIKLDLDRTRIQTEADIKIAEREARALIDDESSTISAIESKLTESAMKQVSLRVASVKARRDAMAVLTPEQSKRVRMFHEKMRERMKAGRHGMGRPHGTKKQHGEEEDDDD